jgi:chromosomal replication initiation ATPase DnaA
VAVQVKLSFPQTINYSLSNFHLHAGIKPCFEHLLAAAKNPGEVRPIVLSGAERVGKTHMLIALSQQLEADGVSPLLLAYEDLQGFVQGADWREFLSTVQVCLIDDFDCFVDDLVRWNNISVAVDLFEACKQTGTKLIVSSRQLLPDFSDLDPHIRSRLSAATWLELGKPSEADIPAMLDLLARQRGLKLSQRQITFLCRRLRQDLGSIEKYLTRLISWSEVAGEPIKLSNISEVLF